MDRHRQNGATQKGQKSKNWPSSGVISIKELIVQIKVSNKLAFKRRAIGTEKQYCFT